jgi:hypothetical protein
MKTLLELLRQRTQPDGGFSNLAGGEYRVDATAWAILALSAAGVAKDLIGSARVSLADRQQGDGRVCISADHPESFWPTPLAVLAWHGSPSHREPQSRAVRFLLATAGTHWEKKADSPITHDTAIRGWPWIADTHSMVEPTSLSLLALRVTGQGGHERAREAVRMLMDRRLPKGGWNYGNTLVYGQELYPQVENTGLALCALAGDVPLEEVRSSLEYLDASIQSLRTPLSLGWGILGLGAWGRRPVRARDWIMESLKRQEKYGPYDTTLLSLLVLAFHARAGGPAGMFGKREGRTDAP